MSYAGAASLALDPYTSTMLIVCMRDPHWLPATDTVVSHVSTANNGFPYRLFHFPSTSFQKAVSSAGSGCTTIAPPVTGARHTTGSFAAATASR